MKKFLFGLLTTGLCFAACPSYAVEMNHEQRAIEVANEVAAKTYTQEELNHIAQAYGYYFVTSIQRIGLTSHLEAFNQGMQEGLKGTENKNMMSPEDLEQAMATINEATLNVISQENLEKANAFLEKNKQEKGVVELEAGKLQIKILQEGQGTAYVNEESTPLIHFKGSFLDGTVFSDSTALGQPRPMPLSNFFPGIKKGLLGMKEGEKRVIYIHPDLAYGTLPFFPPNSLLICEIQVFQTNISDEAKANALTEADADFDIDSEFETEQF